MEEEVFLDTNRLRDHVLQLKKERNYAQTLYEELQALELLAEPEFQASYHKLRNETEGLVCYFGAMANAIEELGEYAEQFMIKVGQILQENLEVSQIRTIFRE